MDWPLRLENHWLACMASAGGGGMMTRIPGGLVVSNQHNPATFLNFIALRNANLADLHLMLEVGEGLLTGYGRKTTLFLSPTAGEMGPLSKRLSELGWRRQEEQVILVIDLPADLLKGAPGVTVTEVDDSGLPLWGRTLIDGYEVLPGVGEEIAEGWSRLMADPGDGSRARFYLGVVGNEPAGTGLAWYHAEGVGLYCGAVRPGWRRAGVERSTLLRRLADAEASGMRFAYLQTESGSPVEHLCINRLGFRQAYRREIWMAPSCGEKMDIL